MPYSQYPNTPTPQRSAKRGVTRPEVVFVLAVALLFVSLVGPGVVGLRRQRQFAQARVEIEALLEAGGRFFSEYGTWPTSQGGEFGDARFGRERPNFELMNALGAVAGPGNEGGSVNPQHMVFLQVDAAAEGRTAAEFTDPWGTPYQVVVDADFDNTCDVRQSIYGRLLGEGMVVWSCGPDRKSDTPDDILSWKMR